MSNCKAPKHFGPNPCFRGQGQEYIEIDQYSYDWDEKTSSVCDSILHEFSNMFDQMLKDKHDYFRDYSKEEDRLDPFIVKEYVIDLYFQIFGV